MAKTYKKINGTWQPIKYIWKNINGTWTKLKKGYKKVSGTWQVVYAASEVKYTFTTSITASTSTGILLKSYVNPADADEFIITVNSGVTLSGRAGSTGPAGVNGGGYNTMCGNMRTNCHGTNGRGYGGNGGSGGAGGYGIDFTGFSGKKITIINNGTIKGGNGGNGGKGGDCAPNQGPTGCVMGSYKYGGCGGSGGSGGAWGYNTNGVTISVSGNAPTSGASGASGASGRTEYCYYSSCD